MKPSYVEGDPKDLVLLDRNARYMTHEQFARLVENVKRDGHLESAPLVWNDPDTGRLIVLSGNHRVKAAVEADLDEIGWLQLDGKLSVQQRIAKQLSHNAIVGQDDPTLLRELYDELSTVDWRQYSGLDDKTLDMLGKVDMSGLGEANLDFTSVQLVFLPGERERAEQALDDAKAAAKPDAQWLAPDHLYGPVLDALETARAAYGVSNTATALSVLIDVVERHLHELSDGWRDPTTGEATSKKWIPVETLLGARQMPADAAAIVALAMDRMVANDDLPDTQRWMALERWAADYLGGA